MTPDAEARRGRLGPLRLLALVAGVVLIGVAIRYAAVRSIDVRPRLWVEWWVTAAVLHDVVVAPIAVLIGWLVLRFAPRAAKAPLQAGLILTAILVAVSYPALRGYGRNPSNLTYLPRHYGSGLVVSLTLVWTACIAWTVLRLVRQRESERAE